jgi:hypothetical protein
MWDQAGRPRDEHELFLDKKEANKALRKQQRKERAIERELFMKKNPSRRIRRFGTICSAISRITRVR